MGRLTALRKLARKALNGTLGLGVPLGGLGRLASRRVDLKGDLIGVAGVAEGAALAG